MDRARDGPPRTFTSTSYVAIHWTDDDTHKNIIDVQKGVVEHAHDVPLSSPTLRPYSVRREET